MGQRLLLALSIIVSLQWAQDNKISPKYLASMEYPQLALAARVEGRVSVRLSIANDGKVVSADAISGNQLLASDAQKNILLWVFPAGPPRATEITYVFKLYDPARTYPHSWNIFDFEHSTVFVSADYLKPEATSNP
jgi:hypothetical protein